MGDVWRFIEDELVIMTSCGKKYMGGIDIPTTSMRTTDLLNSSSIFWRNPNDKCFESAILMYDAKLLSDENAVYKRFPKIQIRTSEIIFFYDDQLEIGDAGEKSRAVSMRDKSQEEMKIVNIITPNIANSFYDISGKFYGLFKKKSHDKFIPLFDASIIEIQKNQDKWAKKNIKLAYNFIGISTRYIEALTFEE